MKLYLMIILLGLWVELMGAIYVYADLAKAA